MSDEAPERIYASRKRLRQASRMDFDIVPTSTNRVGDADISYTLTDPVRDLIDRAIEIMTSDQVGQWEGVRAWQEGFSPRTDLVPDLPQAADLKALLREALGFIGYAACHGDKCRLPHCVSCFGDGAGETVVDFEKRAAAILRGEA